MVTPDIFIRRLFCKILTKFFNFQQFLLLFLIFCVELNCQLLILWRRHHDHNLTCVLVDCLILIFLISFDFMSKGRNLAALCAIKGLIDKS